MAKIGIFGLYPVSLMEKVNEIASRQAKYVDPDRIGERIVGPLGWGDEEGWHYIEVYEVPDDKVHDWMVRFGWFQREYLQLEGFNLRNQLLTGQEEKQRYMKVWEAMDKKVKKK